MVAVGVDNEDVRDRELKSRMEVTTAWKSLRSLKC
jgi:hypothetical protein